MKRFSRCLDMHPKVFIIHLSHIGEADTKGFKVFSDKRGRHQTGNMIGNQHEITCAEIFVYTACRIG